MNDPPPPPRLQSVYSVPVLGAGSTAGRSNYSSTSTNHASNTDTIQACNDFIRQFSRGEGVFPYRDNLHSNILRRQYTLEIEMEDLIGWGTRGNQGTSLADRCRTEPNEMIKLVSQYQVGPAKAHQGVLTFVVSVPV